MDVTDGNYSDGTKPQLWLCDGDAGSANQVWATQEDGSEYSFKTLGGDLCVDLMDGAAVVGTQVSRLCNCLEDRY